MRSARAEPSRLRQTTLVLVLCVFSLWLGVQAEGRVGVLFERTSANTQADTSKRVSFRNTNRGYYEVLASSSTTRTAGHLERVTYACTNNNQLEPIDVINLAEALPAFRHTSLPRRHLYGHADSGEVVPFKDPRLGLFPRLSDDPPLGPIAHSSPMIAVAPEMDLPFPSYQAFRAQHGLRDTMLYAGSNDGFLHAFTLGATHRGSNSRDEGQELWGFMPNTVRDKLEKQTPDEIGQPLLEGTPVIRDIRMWKDPKNSRLPEYWRTVLAMGLGSGGRAYFALDITEPKRWNTFWGLRDNQALLWEITPDTPGFERLGHTYAEPTLGVVHIEKKRHIWAKKHRTERAVAVLSGGLPAGEEEAHAPGEHCPDLHIGEAVYIVDLATGELLRRFHELSNGEPLPVISGAPALFNAFAGALATRAFVGDARGRLLRLDMSSPDPGAWTLDVFFDPKEDIEAFAKSRMGTAAPVFYKPAIARSGVGELVVIFGNGDHQSGAFQHVYVASVTEKLIVKTAEARRAQGSERGEPHFSYEPRLNWAQPLDEKRNEKLTGSPIIFNRTAYFPTHQRPLFGEGVARLYAVHFLNNSAVHDLRVDGEPDADRYAEFKRGFIAGLHIASRPACFTTKTLRAPRDGSPYLRERIDTYTAHPPQLILQTPHTIPSHIQTTHSREPDTLADVVRIDLPHPQTSLIPVSWSLVYD